MWTVNGERWTANGERRASGRTGIVHVPRLTPNWEKRNQTEKVRAMRQLTIASTIERQQFGYGCDYSLMSNVLPLPYWISPLFTVRGRYRCLRSARHTETTCWCCKFVLDAGRWTVDAGRRSLCVLVTVILLSVTFIRWDLCTYVCMRINRLRAHCTIRCPRIERHVICSYYNSRLIDNWKTI